MIIRAIENSDIVNLTYLHKKIFGKTHFTSTFSLELLTKYFKELIKYHQYKLAVIEDNIVIGYLIAGINPDVPVKIFLKNNLLALVLVLIKNPSFLVEKLIESFSFLYPKKQNIHKNEISIYLIAVDTSIQNKGIGKTLLKHFEQQLIHNKINKYTLAVRSGNYATIEFYKKNNFIEIFRDYKTITYMKKLSL